MKVLGIDPGLALTGWGVVEKKNSEKLVDYGCFKTKAGVKSEMRLLSLFRQLQETIDSFKPEVVAVEKLFFNTNAKTALQVGEARGVVKLLVSQNSLPLVEFTPLQIKNSITGYGRADKKQVQLMVKSLLGLKQVPRPDDAADAVAVALTYCFYKPSLEK